MATTTKSRSGARRSKQSQGSKNARPKAKARPKPKTKAKPKVRPKAKTKAKPKVRPKAKATGQIAARAKVPLVAAGAATAGAAAGLAWGARHASSRSPLRAVMPRRPKVKITSRDMARAAKEIGSFGSQVGHLAAELEAARENGAANGSRHRSPVEVVLEGLTSRR
jgi:hypothetical protein